MIKNIIFDLDGTLADTISDITKGLNGMLSELNFPLVDTSQTLANINNGALELVRRSLPSEYHENEPFVKNAKKVYEKYYSKCYKEATAEYTGCTAALKQLSELGITLSVLSNKQDEFVKKIVKKLFPEIGFAFVLGQSERFKPKPSPEAINFIISSLSFTPDETTLIGDSNVDILTAKNASIIPVGVSWGYRSKDILLECGAKHIIDTPREIPHVLNIFKNR